MGSATPLSSIPDKCACAPPRSVRYRRGSGQHGERHEVRFGRIDLDHKLKAWPSHRAADECGHQLGELLVPAGPAYAVWWRGTFRDRTRRRHAFAEFLFRAEQHLYSPLMAS